MDTILGMTTIATVVIRRNVAGDHAVVGNVPAGEATRLACSRGIWTCLAGQTASSCASGSDPTS